MDRDLRLLEWELSRLKDEELESDMLDEFGGEFELNPSQELLDVYRKEYAKRGKLPPIDTA